VDKGAGAGESRCKDWGKSRPTGSQPGLRGVAEQTTREME
jgi:hypothetical protein